MSKYILRRNTLSRIVILFKINIYMKLYNTNPNTIIRLFTRVTCLSNMSNDCWVNFLLKISLRRPVTWIWNKLSVWQFLNQFFFSFFFQEQQLAQKSKQTCPKITYWKSIKKIVTCWIELSNRTNSKNPMMDYI